VRGSSSNIAQSRNLRQVCPVCDGTGLVPFIKDDRRVPNAWLHCACRMDEPEHCRPLESGDFDFPISWDWHRYYCREYGLPDPGPCEPPEYTLGELHARLASIEEKLACLSEQERRRLGLKAIWEEVKQLRLGLRHTQKLIPRKPAGMKRSSLKAKKTRGFVIDERAES